MSTFKKVVAILLTLIATLSVSACGGESGNGGNGGNNGGGAVEEQIDTSKTQIYVYNFNGGFGSEWLVKLGDRFEALHENDVYEEGKKGVQVWVDNKKTSIESISSQVLDNRSEIYFTEYAYYYTLKSLGILGDITDAVTGDLSAYGDAAGKTIESKLTDEQKAYYGVKEGGETHYYGIPHYAGYSGLVYNVDLFNQKCWYFAKNPVPELGLMGYFVESLSDERSYGPDGKTGVINGVDYSADDGLPSTYEEFYILCDYIAQSGQQALLWTGQHRKHYINNLISALETDYNGLEESMLMYNLNGTAKNLGTIVNGAFVKDSTDTIITSENGYETFRTEGRYRALEFVQKIATTDKWHNPTKTESDTYSHMNAQEDYLYAGHDGGFTAETAMLVEGIWWENEATPYFNTMVDRQGESFSRLNRKFAWMPLPKANAELVGTENTLYDHIYSMCFMKANVAEWKRDLLIEFIKFANSDVSLKEFSQVTNTPKALSYTMSDAEMTGMSYFGKSLMARKQQSQIVYPYSTTPKYINNQGWYSSLRLFEATFTIDEDYPIVGFTDKNYSAAQWFTASYNRKKNDWAYLQ